MICNALPESFNELRVSFFPHVEQGENRRFFSKGMHMYNILVFGIVDKYSELLESFSDLPCNFIHINSSVEFYATAFSRIFDAWFIDACHADTAELALHELISNLNVPHIFSCCGTIRKLAEENVTVVDGTDLATGREKFEILMHNRREQNREKYLAGYVQDQPGIEAIVTKSQLMATLLDLIKDVAPTDSPVLVQGETGTGKELLANIFHNESRRRLGPFMAVNCGALPDNLLESELFGYEKGAFTGATSRRIGKIEHASGGTLFLDEIESMSHAMQVRLLRVLQEKSLQRLGGNQEILTDFRVIGATNIDPLELVHTGKLRSDLYYRLSVFQINVPPLRDRTEDIPALVQHFVNRKRKNGRDYVKGVDEQTMQILLSVPWYGNIRELQNVIERAVILANSEVITPDLIHIPNNPLNDTTLENANLSEYAFGPGTTLKSYKNLLNQAAERKYLVELLEYTRGRIGESAQLAGLTPRALYNKMKIHGLKKEDYRKSELN